MSRTLIDKVVVKLQINKKTLTVGAALVSLSVLTLLVYLTQLQIANRIRLSTILVTVYITFEIFFYILETIRYYRVNCSDNVAVNERRMREAMDNFKSLKHVLDIEEFLQGWFMGTPSNEIYRDNMVEFIAYGFYSKSPSQLSDAERCQIDQFLTDTTDVFDISFRDGYNPKASRFMRHTLEDIRAFHKPLLVHIFVEMLGLVCMVILRWMGFSRLKTHKECTTKWIHTPPKLDTEKPPIIFLHGVGFGALPYMHFISSLLSLHLSRPIIVVEMGHVGMRLFARDAPDLQRIARDIIDAMNSIGYDRGVFIGHSYGTFVISKIVQDHPHSVDNMCLMDPVCLMTCHPSLTANFIYRTCDSIFPLSLKKIFEIAQFVFSRDVSLAQTFCRKFHGMEAMLWEHEISGAKSVIVLSGKDPLVPTALVMKQLKESERVHILYHDTHTHGSWLFDGSYLTFIVQHVLRKQLLTD